MLCRSCSEREINIRKWGLCQSCYDHHKYKKTLDKLYPYTPPKKKTTPLSLVTRQREWQKNNPEKAYAQELSHYHKDHLLILYECPCDHPKKHNHHPDYNEPFMVIRLCPACHAKEHARLRSLSALAETNSSTPAVLVELRAMTQGS